MSSNVDDWDAVCVAQTRALLLRDAAVCLEQAATKKTPVDRVAKLTVRANRCMNMAASMWTGPRVGAHETEAMVRKFIREVFELEDPAARAVVDRIKHDAQALRGQLDFFDDTARQVDSFIATDLSDGSGALIPALVRNELLDYFTLISAASRVFAHVTNEQVSNHRTTADVVIALADDETDRLVTKAVEEKIEAMTVEDFKAQIRAMEAFEESKKPCAG